MSLTITKEVEVDIDVDVIIDALTDRELGKIGLYRINKTTAASDGGADDDTMEDAWLEVRTLVRHGDYAGLLNKLNTMAWNQAGIMIPIAPTLKVARA